MPAEGHVAAGLGLIAALLPLAVPLALVGVLAPFSLWFLAAPAAVLSAFAAFAVAVAAAVEPARDEVRPLAFRALVSVLHLAQPLTRAWGRFCARRPEAAPARRHGWTGDRGAWLAELQSALAARRGRVRVGGPSKSFDLSVSIGPFLQARLTTAVVWWWTPIHRVRFRIRPWTVASVAALGALALAAPAWALGGLGALAIAAAIEGVLLRSLVREAVASTTDEALLKAEWAVQLVQLPVPARCRLPLEPGRAEE